MQAAAEAPSVPDDVVHGRRGRGLLDGRAYPDDGLGEVFLKFGKQGSTLAGVMDAFSIAVSVGLQYGVPLETFVEKFTSLRFEPAGLTDDPDIRMAQSPMRTRAHWDNVRGENIDDIARDSREWSTGHEVEDELPGCSVPCAHPPPRAQHTGDTGEAKERVTLI